MSRFSAVQPSTGPTTGDAFGQGLLAWLDDPDTVVVIERDDGFVDVDHLSQNYFGSPSEWSERCRWAVDRARGRVLDVGAGAGRSALELQDRGQEVMALDVSESAIEVCRRRGVRDTFVGTVNELAATRPEPFDSVLLLGNNVGLLEDPAHAESFLDALTAMTRPGSKIVGTGLDPYYTDKEFHLRYHEANRARGRLAGQVTIRARFRNIATDWFDLLWCSLDELAEICEPAGWCITETYEGALYGVVLERT